MSQLTWSPVYNVLEDRIKSGDEIILLIVPFITLGALQQLHFVGNKMTRVKVVCRWRPNDLITGVSDVEIFTFLKAAGCELYVNPDVHMKLYVFESNVAFNTSANLTLRGLGYSQPANLEVGNIVQLTPDDLAMIYRIVATSRQVDDEMYARFKAYVDQNHAPGPATVPPDLLGKPKAYTIASLPATESPAKLAHYYFNSEPTKHSTEDVRRAVHDLVTFSLPATLNVEEFDLRLGDAFRKTQFVTDFVEFLKSKGSLRFGAVNSWIHDKCEDVPLPYRWEIKENTHIFYDWLAHYFPEITWDRPNYSQVIYWQKK